MYNVTQIIPPIISPKTINKFHFSPHFLRYSPYSPNSSQTISVSSNSLTYSNKIHSIGCASEQGSVQGFDPSPISLELEPIANENQFDRVIAEAQQLEESVIILWMARWCRKYIYLKPKLEKLAANYYPRIRFFCVDVNNVSHQLVVRAGVIKMPIIQLWKDSKKQDEVIGGSKAYLVANEVCEMIEKESEE